MVYWPRRWTDWPVIGVSGGSPVIRSAWLVLILPLVSVAAPVPKESMKEQVEKAFGKIDDPDGDCKFTLEGGKLKITMKGRKRYDYWEKVTNCPRTTREVKGDFVVTAKVYAELSEKAVPVKGDLAEAGAGLIILGEEKQAWQTGMHDFGGTKRNWMLIAPGPHGPTGFGIKYDGDGAHVRLTRKGNKLTMSIRSDGKEWAEPISMSDTREESLWVGVYGFSNSKDDTTVTITEFSIEQPKEKKEDKK